ncbi:MAG: putative gamma-glutamyltranspeptidase [Geminicoccaceae bacterium]|nr:putative gamma-glutamyltranspeptidase [Geminicoccaceae bacterium]
MSERTVPDAAVQPFAFAPREPVRSMTSMVATSQRRASEVGAAVLRNGGTAADACVAMDAMLHVTEPTSTGLGGDMFALHFEARTGKVTALNGSGRAPLGRTLADVARDERGQIPQLHGDAVTVPGVCAGWFDLIARHGTMPISEVLVPAIETAESGFEVGPITAAAWERNLGQLRSRELTLDGRAPRAGEVFRNPGLARVLERIGVNGRSAFYEGPVAEAIASAARRYGSALTADDLARHESTWEGPIAVAYRGIRVWECPPNGQGLAALLALAILEELPVHPVGSVERVHLQIEALRLGFADARWYVADPGVSPAPLEALLSRSYASERRRFIEPYLAAAHVKHGVPASIPGTVYFCAVDAAGNACSYVSSTYLGFGTGIVPEGLGFSLQNRGRGFSLDAGHPNVFAPGKRPYHTIISGMLTRDDGSLLGPFGVMGGVMQPQGHVQVVTALVDDAADPQEALDRSRFFIEPEIDGGRVYLESGTSRTVADGLRARAHDIVVNPQTQGRTMFGRGQIIVRQSDGSLAAGSDQRADGCALAC